ncbi:MAG: serine hydrolase domain-containing protein [Actinomycetota bacterium]
MDTRDKILREIGKVASGGRSGEVLWRMRSDDGALDVTYGDAGRPFFIASGTKLYVTAILAQLHDEGLLRWDSPIAAHLPDLNLTGLSAHQGRDLGSEITVQQVMAHTAGLPDYFEGKRPDSATTFAQALDADFAWDLGDVLNWSREIGPGAPGKGRYSDTGYQILGAVIESLDARPFAQSVHERICTPLGLERTYVFCRHDIERYDTVTPLRVGDKTVTIPQAMASVQADGGIVSTLADGMRFLDAFFDGTLVNPTTLRWICSDWHRIFFPLAYGNGIMRFRMPAIMTGLRRVAPYIGHSGASGTVMFRAPDLGITVVGTVNQAEHRSMPFQLLIRTTIAASRR